MRTIWPISQIKRTLQERKAEREHETPEQKAARSTAKATWWIAAFTIVLAGVGILTLYEVMESGKDTQALANAASIQAQAAITQTQKFETLATNAGAQSIAALGQLDQLQALAKATQQTADLARQANRNTLEALHITEAADIEIDRLVCSPTNTQPLGLTTEINMVFSNRGRTGATAVRTMFYLSVHGQQINPASQQGSVSSVGPGQPMESVRLRVDESLTEDLLRIVNSGRLIFHAWGWVLYKDRFGISHITIYEGDYIPKSSCGFQVARIVSR